MQSSYAGKSRASWEGPWMMAASEVSEVTNEQTKKRMKSVNFVDDRHSQASSTYCASSYEPSITDSSIDDGDLVIEDEEMASTQASKAYQDGSEDWSMIEKGESENPSALKTFKKKNPKDPVGRNDNKRFENPNHFTGLIQPGSEETGNKGQCHQCANCGKFWVNSLLMALWLMDWQGQKPDRICLPCSKKKVVEWDDKRIGYLCPMSSSYDGQTLPPFSERCDKFGMGTQVPTGVSDSISDSVQVDSLKPKDKEFLRDTGSTTFEWNLWERYIKKRLVCIQIQYRKNNSRMKRGVCYAQAKLDIDQRYPNETCKEYKKRLLAHTTAIAVSLVAGICHWNETQMKEVMNACEELKDDLEAQATDPEFVPTVNTNELRDYDCQYLYALSNKTDEHYFCRKKDCLMVIRSEDWVPNMGGEGLEKEEPTSWACPVCASVYRPWKKQAACVDANKVLVLKSLTPAELNAVIPNKTKNANLMRRDAFSSSPAERNDEDRVVMLPFVWPDSCPQAWMNKVKQAQANITQELQAVESQEERFDIVMKSLAKLPAPHYMKKMEMDAKAVQACKWYNAQTSTGKKKLNWPKIQEKGFYGCKFANYSDDDIISADDVLRIVGMASFLIAAARQNKVNKTTSSEGTK